MASLSNGAGAAVAARGELAGRVLINAQTGGPLSRVTGKHMLMASLSANDPGRVHGLGRWPTS